MAEIVLSILSRSRPELTAAAIKLMYDGCYDPNNFEIHLVIDSDQIELYAPVLKKYPQIKLGVVEHQKGNLRRCFIKQLEMFRETSAYFMLTLADDMTAVVKNWDRMLLSKKGYFKDDMFTLYSNCRECFRSTEVMQLCYCPPQHSTFYNRAIDRASGFAGLDPKNNPLDADFLMLYEFCELFPVHTYKFAKYVELAYKQSQHAIGIDIVIASLVQQLYRLTGENRLVLGWEDNFRHINNNFFDACIRGSFKQRTPFDMKLSRALAADMAKEILGPGKQVSYSLPATYAGNMQEYPALRKIVIEDSMIKTNQPLGNISNS